MELQLTYLHESKLEADVFQKTSQKYTLCPKDFILISTKPQIFILCNLSYNFSNNMAFKDLSENMIKH